MVGLDLDADPASAPVGTWAPEWAARKIREEAIPHAIAHGSWKGESAYLGPDGEEIPVSQIVIAHRDRRGRPAYVSTIARDLSERLELERMKQQFVSQVTHELKTPLTRIIGYVSMILGDELGFADDDAKSGLEVVNRSAGQLKALIDDLLAFQRQETLPKADASMVDVAAVVSAVVEVIAPMAVHGGVHVVVDTHSAHVQGERTDIERAVTNFVSNTIKFTQSGGVVTVELAVNPQVTVTVTDTGIGMSEDDLKRLGQAFYRTERAERLGIPGTGLGVSIVDQIARRHGGSLNYESAVGEGTVAVLALGDPVQPKPETIGASGSAGPPSEHS